MAHDPSASPPKGTSLRPRRSPVPPPASSSRPRRRSAPKDGVVPSPRSCPRGPRKRGRSAPWLVAAAAAFGIGLPPPSRGFSVPPTPAPSPSPSPAPTAATPPPRPPPILPAYVAGGAFVLSYPSSGDDFRQVGSLLVDVFDEPLRRGRTSGNEDSDEDEEEGAPLKTDASSPVDDAAWKFLGRPVLERFVTARYEDLARRLRGKKHALVVAKRWRREEDGGGRGREVVGMAELGVSPIPPPAAATVDGGGEIAGGTAEGSLGGDGGDGDGDDEPCAPPVPTLGLVAVSPRARGSGLGRALVRVCERIASSPAWGGGGGGNGGGRRNPRLYAAVEPDNEAALRLFATEGYERCCAAADDAAAGDSAGDDGGVSIVTVRVRDGLRTAAKPHILLCKDLRGDDARDGEGASQ